LDQLTKEQIEAGVLLLVDKPLHWTSFDVVNKIKSMCKYRFDLKKVKIGHAGTLDPLATGLLLICTGKWTRKLEAIQAEQKEYTGTIFVGATTPSYDLETAINDNYPTDHIASADLIHAAQQLSGNQMQVPPAFSAIKMDGKRVYKKARAGKEIEIAPRPVQIFSFEVDGSDFPEISFKIVCSKGTYIRSIAHDFGKILGSGAYLKSLRRTGSGNYRVEDALDMASIEQLFSGGNDTYTTNRTML
jgi:tRNA pseudouridine55 synthase